MSFTKVDLSKNYRIESVPSKSIPQLAEKGIGSYPGTMVVIRPSWDYNLNKAKNTGLDENDPEVLQMNPEDRKEAIAWIKECRKNLEARIGQEGYLAPSSDGWSSELATVMLETAQDLKIKVNDHDNVLRPMMNHKDAISLLILMNDPTFPKSKKDTSNPKYRNAKYYITTEEEKDEQSKGEIQKTRKANIKMAELFDNGENKDKAWQLAFYMGLVRKQDASLIELEKTLQSAVFGDKTGETLNKFLEACELKNADLLLNNMFNQAINFGIVKVGSDGMYYRGNSNYRKSIADSVSYLQMPDMATELAGLREEVQKKLKVHKSAK